MPILVIWLPVGSSSVASLPGLPAGGAVTAVRTMESREAGGCRHSPRRGPSPFCCSDSTARPGVRDRVASWAGSGSWGPSASPHSASPACSAAGGAVAALAAIGRRPAHPPARGDRRSCCWRGGAPGRRVGADGLELERRARASRHLGLPADQQPVERGRRRCLGRATRQPALHQGMAAALVDQDRGLHESMGPTSGPGKGSASIWPSTTGSRRRHSTEALTAGTSAPGRPTGVPGVALWFLLQGVFGGSYWRPTCALVVGGTSGGPVSTCGSWRTGSLSHRHQLRRLPGGPTRGDLVLECDGLRNRRYCRPRGGSGETGRCGTAAGVGA